MEHRIKAQLVPNALTPEANDYVAIVESFGSVGISDIVAELQNEGMELKPETVTDVITRFNRKCIDLVLRGYSVNTGLMNMHATIKGAFYGKEWNPEVNKLHVSIAQGAELRKEVAESRVEITGEKAEPIAIFGITDKKTGAIDGTITPGFNAEVKGSYIKLVGDDPTCGVHLVNTDDESDTQLPAENIVINEPSRLLLLIPGDLPAGTYRLSVTTQYATGTKPLKQPRSATFPGDVIVA